MKNHFIIAILILLMSSTYAQQAWTMELVVPIGNPAGERIISLDRYPRFHIIMKNVSPQVQRLWKDWNTWGFFNLNLIWKAGDQVHQIRKKTPTAWDGDFPDFWVVPAGESLILEVDMTTGIWEGIPDLYGERIPATLQATYENKRDGLANKFGIWVGKVASEEIEIVFQ